MPRTPRFARKSQNSSMAVSPRESRELPYPGYWDLKVAKTEPPLEGQIIVTRRGTSRYSCPCCSSGQTGGHSQSLTASFTSMVAVCVHIHYTHPEVLWARFTQAPRWDHLHKTTSRVIDFTPCSETFRQSAVGFSAALSPRLPSPKAGGGSIIRPQTMRHPVTNPVYASQPATVPGTRPPIPSFAPRTPERPADSDSEAGSSASSEAPSCPSSGESASLACASSLGDSDSAGSGSGSSDSSSQPRAASNPRLPAVPVVIPSKWKLPEPQGLVGHDKCTVIGPTDVGLASPRSEAAAVAHSAEAAYSSLGCWAEAGPSAPRTPPRDEPAARSGSYDTPATSPHQPSPAAADSALLRWRPAVQTQPAAQASFSFANGVLTRIPSSGRALEPAEPTAPPLPRIVARRAVSDSADSQHSWRPQGSPVPAIPGPVIMVPGSPKSPGGRSARSSSGAGPGFKLRSRVAVFVGRHLRESAGQSLRKGLSRLGQRKGSGAEDWVLEVFSPLGAGLQQMTGLPAPESPSTAAAFARERELARQVSAIAGEVGLAHPDTLALVGRAKALPLCPGTTTIVERLGLLRSAYYSGRGLASLPDLIARAADDFGGLDAIAVLVRGPDGYPLKGRGCYGRGGWIYVYRDPSNHEEFKVGLAQDALPARRITRQVRSNGVAYETVSSFGTPEAALVDALIKKMLAPYNVRHEAGEGRTEWYTGLSQEGLLGRIGQAIRVVRAMYGGPEPPMALGA